MRSMANPISTSTDCSLVRNDSHYGSSRRGTPREEGITRTTTAGGAITTTKTTSAVLLDYFKVQIYMYILTTIFWNDESPNSRTAIIR